MLKKKENNITFRSAVSQLRPDGCKLHQKAAGSTWGQAFPLLDQKTFFWRDCQATTTWEALVLGGRKPTERCQLGFPYWLSHLEWQALSPEWSNEGWSSWGWELRGHWKREGRGHDGWAQGRSHGTRLGPAQKQPLCQYPCPVVRKSSNQFIPAHTRKWKQQ